MLPPPFLGNDLLRGEWVALARPTSADYPVIASWSSDIEYMRMLRRGLVYPGSAEGFGNWLEGMMQNESGFPFAIRGREDGGLLGFVLIHDIFWQARHGSVVIGIDPAQRGHGYGTDALRVLLKYAFLEMNFNRVGLEVMSYNAAGIRAYTKVGFVQEGRLRAFVYRDGVYYDILTMSILRPEWEALYLKSPASAAAPE